MTFSSNCQSKAKETTTTCTLLLLLLLLLSLSWHCGVVLGQQQQWNMGVNEVGEFELRYGTEDVLRLGVSGGRTYVEAVGLVFEASSTPCSGVNLLSNNGAEAGSTALDWEVADSSPGVFDVCDASTSPCSRNVVAKSGTRAFNAGNGSAIAMRQLVEVVGYDTGADISFSGWTYQFPADEFTATLTFYDDDQTTVMGSPIDQTITRSRSPALLFLNFEEDFLGDPYDDKAGLFGTVGVDTSVGSAVGLFTLPKLSGSTFQPYQTKQFALTGSIANSHPLKVDLGPYLTDSDDSSFTLLMAVRVSSSATLMTLAELYASAAPTGDNVALYADSTNTRLEVRANFGATAATASFGTLTVGDWHIVAMTYDGTALSVWMTNNAAFTTPLHTITDVFESQIDTLLLGQDQAAAARGLGPSQIDLVTLVRGALPVAGLNAYRTAISNNDPFTDFNFGYGQFRVTGNKPAGAAYAEAKIAVADGNSDNEMLVVVDDLSVACLSYDP